MLAAKSILVRLLNQGRFQAVFLVRRDFLMTTRAMLLGLFGLVSVAGTIGAEQPDKTEARAARVRSLRRQIMDLESIGRERVSRDRGAKVITRPAVKAEYNVDSFAAVKARFVRFNVLATVNGSEPCLDALEVYGPDGATNLTEGARTTASSAHAKLGNFNGGKYGKGWCWTSKEPGKGWVQVELSASAKIDRVVWSRDTLNRYHDRVPSSYTIEVSEDGGAWQTVATSEGRAAPGNTDGFSRSTLVKALEPAQQKKRQELLLELIKLGAPRPNECKSGPQPGDFIRKFFVHGVNTSLNGKKFCPV
jgi:hypothetical protein